MAWGLLQVAAVPDRCTGGREVNLRSQQLIGLAAAHFPTKEKLRMDYPMQMPLPFPARSVARVVAIQSFDIPSIPRAEARERFLTELRWQTSKITKRRASLGGNGGARLFRLLEHDRDGLAGGPEWDIVHLGHVNAEWCSPLASQGVVKPPSHGRGLEAP